MTKQKQTSLFPLLRIIIPNNVWWIQIVPNMLALSTTVAMLEGKKPDFKNNKI